MKPEYQHYKGTVITREPDEQGESIEEMLRRCTANNEPIKGEAPMIYTEKAQGVRPEYDIRTDRFDLALEAINHVQKTAIAQSANNVEQPNSPEDSAPTDVTE